MKSFEGQIISKNKNRNSKADQRLSKLKKIVSKNLKNLENLYENNLYTRNNKYMRSRSNQFKKPRVANHDLRNKENNNSRNFFYSKPVNTEGLSKERNSLNPKAVKAPFKDILMKLRNKSLKLNKKLKYKSRLFSRDKYIKQRLSQMLMLKRI